ncbi:hypothetical protein KO498_12280, partial [Lentibacter algarum]|uniref:hypothetical protein n=1 Tax=Lentibacter algarum TaxID=576131 RepID=UPI001C0959C9
CWKTSASSRAPTPTRKPMLLKKPFWINAAILACLAGLAVAEPVPLSEWTAQKCVLYTEGWNWVLETQDLSGARSEFLSEHQSFIDAGCDHAIEICPLSKGDLALANLLTLISMNEGMASTFVPFACEMND